MRLYTFFRFFFFLFWLPSVVNDRRHRFDRIKVFVLRVRTSLLLLLFGLALGTSGYMIIEDAPFFESYYMSVITLATVGFSEIIELSREGRIFTSVLIIFNLGLFTYAVSTLTGIFAEGGFTKILSEFHMIEQINHLSGHTIVCGFGRHAGEVCAELAKQGVPFVVIERNEDKVLKIREEYPDYLFLEGDATEDFVLTEAGIERAAALVATLPSDADNLFIVLSARQMKPSLRIISRAIDESDEAKIKRAGADHVVMPERIGGFYMATLINKPDLVEFFTLLSNMGPSNVIFEEIPVKQLHEKYQNRSIEDSRLDTECRMPIVAIRYANGQYALNPPPNEVLRPDSRIVVFGNQTQMQRFRDMALG